MKFDMRLCYFSQKISDRLVEIGKTYSVRNESAYGQWVFDQGWEKFI